MTVEKFRELKPEYKNIEGDQLWNAMEDYMLQQQCIKTIKPLWKRYKLRWIFYRKRKNFVIANIKTPKYTATERCSNCKKGVNIRIGLMITLKDGSTKSISNCPYCGKEYKGEPNTNLSHKFYMLLKQIVKGFWLILNFLHIIRYSFHGRYDMFGDEAQYIKGYTFDKDWSNQKTIMRKRKWYEYILIKT